MKKTALYLVSLVVLVILLGASMTFVGTRPAVHAIAGSGCISGETNCLSGWAWSSNIGWVSFNSSDTGSAVAYDVAMDASGNLSGYGWSSNIGWISFNLADLSVAPACSTIAPAKVDTASGAVTGWVRAVAGKGRTDGWDGCIELAGTNHSSPNASGYNGTSTLGVTYSSSSHKFSGFAWGGDVVGWLQFGPTAGYDVVCAPTGVCPGTSNSLSFTADSGAYASVTSLTVQKNAPVTLHWSIQNMANCQTSNWSDVAVSSNPVPIGQSSASTLVGSGNVSYSTIGDHTLQIACDVPNTFPADRVERPITIHVEDTVIPITTCGTPAHASMCPGSNNSDSSQLHIYENGDSVCQTTTSSCQFQCVSGYKLKNGICARSSIEEI